MRMLRLLDRYTPLAAGAFPGVLRGGAVGVRTARRRARAAAPLAAVALLLSATDLRARDVTAAAPPSRADARACPVRPDTATGGPTVRVRSLLPSLAAWERAAPGLDSAARVAAFRRLVLDASPDLFGPVFPVRDDARLAGYLAWLEPRLAAMHALAPGIAAAVPDAAARVGALFPSLARDTVDVVIGVGFMSNGTVRLVDGRPVLFLGPDVHTLVEPDVADPLVLVAHELVHVAHARANPAVYALVDSAMRRLPSPLDVSVFSEGLATWASGCAAPGRSLAVRLLSSALAREAPAAAGRLLPQLRAELGSTDPSRYGDWFFAGGRPTDIPPRFAYWAGDAIVAELARTLAPEALLRLPADTVARMTAAALDRLIARGAAASPHDAAGATRAGEGAGASAAAARIPDPHAFQDSR